MMYSVPVILLLIGACLADDFDNDFSPNERKGPWVSAADNFDDRDEEVLCGVARHTLINCKCELGSKDEAANRWCDGNWIIYNATTERDECHSYTNAHTEGHIRAVAMCQQIIIYPFAPEKPARLGPNPSISCPDGYQMLDCWVHADVMDEEHWRNNALFKKNVPGNSCVIDGCKECRIQASCLRKVVETPASLDTFETAN